MAEHTDPTPRVPGQRQQAPAESHDQQQDTPGAAVPPREKKPRLAAWRKRWENSWDDGFLHDRWEDLCRAPELGWHGMANWLKTGLAVAGTCVVILLLKGAAGVLADSLHTVLTAAPRVQVGTDTSHGVFSVVDQPVRSYIAAHSASLQISASTVYTLWQVVGLFGLIGGAFRSSGARLTWTAWGAATIAMVWNAAPADGRTIATGLAVLAWSAASALALRGLSLRPVFFTHVHNAGHQIEPHLHLTAPAAPAGDTPDNVHPLQKR